MREREEITSLEDLNEVARNFLAERIREYGFEVRLGWPRIVKNESFPNLPRELSGRLIQLYSDGRLTAQKFFRRSLSEEKEWLEEEDLHSDEYLQYVRDALALIESDKRADDAPGVVVI